MSDKPAPVSPKLKKDWQFYAGVVCLGLSLIMPLFGLLVPMLGLPTALTAAIIGTLAIGGPEVALLAALALLGNETLAYFKARFFRLLRREVDVGPVSRRRYYTGMGIALCSQIPHLLDAYWFNQAVSVDWTMHRTHLLAGADLILMSGVLVMGPEFIDKFKRLFIYDGIGSEPEWSV